MPSRGAGSDITLQDAIDLLHKLMTEETKLVAVLDTPSGLKASVTGRLKRAPDDTLWVVDEDSMPPHIISFDPRSAVRRTYGDSRTLVPVPTTLPEGMPRRFESALCFSFSEGTRLCLFEVAEES